MSEQTERRRARPRPMPGPRPAADHEQDPAGPSADQSTAAPGRSRSSTSSSSSRSSTSSRRQQPAARKPPAAASPPAFERRLTLPLTPELDKALKLAKIEDGIDTATRLRAMIGVYLEKERYRASVDNRARHM